MSKAALLAPYSLSMCCCWCSAILICFSKFSVARPCISISSVHMSHRAMMEHIKEKNQVLQLGKLELFLLLQLQPSGRKSCYSTVDLANVETDD